MKDHEIEFAGYRMRLIQIGDIDSYYKYGFEKPDEEAKYYTGTTENHSKEQIISYVNSIVENKSRFDFIILKEDEIIGEVVLSDIKDRNCHYRICIFRKENFSKGIGYRATIELFKFAFEDLNLESVELEVFPFNERGIALYKKMGFEVKEEFVDEEAEDPYRDVIIMKIEVDKFQLKSIL